MQYWLALNAEDIDALPDPLLQGVGLIRGEYPMRYREEYITLESCRSYLSRYIAEVCEAVTPAEVWYRTSEFIASEINVLAGADAILEEPHESMGSRGIRRGLRFPDTYRLELQIVAKLSHRYPNLHVLFPFVTSPRELETAVQMLRDAGHRGKYGMMAEIPCAILLLDEFLRLGVSNVTIGVNDLTTFTLAAARGSALHDPCHPAVLQLISTATKSAHKANVPVAVAGGVTRELANLIAPLGVDRLVVHYMDLPSVLGTPPEHLPYRDQVRQIKALTKQRRMEREESQWRARLSGAAE